MAQTDFGVSFLLFRLIIVYLCQILSHELDLECSTKRIFIWHSFNAFALDCSKVFCFLIQLMEMIEAYVGVGSGRQLCNAWA